MTFGNDYEALCAAMAMVDAAISQVEDLASNDDHEWSQNLYSIRNEMNAARLACLSLFGKRVYHVDDIAAARPTTPGTGEGE